MGSFSSKYSLKPKAAVVVTEADRAILSLKTQRRKLADYQKRTQASVDREQEAIREWIKTGNKQRALLHLKKKRLQEDALQRVDAWVMKIEEQLVAVEAAGQQAQVVGALKLGQEAMAALQKELKLEDVEKLLEDTESSKAHLQEVQEMLDAQLTSEEEEAVLKELEELEAELGLLEETTIDGAGQAVVAAPERQKEQIPDADAAVDAVAAEFPDVPKHTPSIKTPLSEEADEEEEAPQRVKVAPLAA